MAIPTFVAAGSVVQLTTGGTPTVPATATANDLLILYCETAQEAVTNPNAGVWTAGPQSPLDTTGGSLGTRITTFYAWETGGGIADPTIADPGDHLLAVILAYRGVDTTTPFHQSAQFVAAGNQGAWQCNSVTTTIADCLITGVSATGRDQLSSTFHGAPTNGALSSLAEVFQFGTAAGNGGSLQVWTGGKATAGATGNTTGSLGNNNGTTCGITYALAPTAGGGGAAGRSYVVMVG